jgi:hypothetical protein
MADRQAIICPMGTANVPSILTSVGVAIAANPVRGSWSIQNLGTNPLFVLRGTGASNSVFHHVLKAGTSNDDGTGGSIAEENGVIWTGVLSVAGTSPRYVVTELIA